MPTNRTIGMLLSGIVIITFIFWMAGAVESFWTGLGIATLLLLFFATSLLTAYKKTAVVILILALLFLFIRHMTPETIRNAVATKAVSAGIRTSVTIGNPAAEIEKNRLVTCKKDANATNDREIRPREKELNDMNSGLRPFDTTRRNALIKEIKDWEETIKNGAADCMKGLRYAVPSLPDIPEPHLPSTRPGATLLLAALLLSGWGIYRSTKDSRWTRWVGGPILILAILYLVVLFFDAGGDKKIEEGIERWQISMKESPKPPPPPPAPKEEKKIIVTKEKRWREAKNGEGNLFSTYPFGRWSIALNRGERFDVPPMGEGSCSAIFVESGGIETRLFDREGRELNGSRLVADTRPSTNCNNHLIKIVATQDDTRLEGGACRAPNKWCLVYD